MPARQTGHIVTILGKQRRRPSSLASSSEVYKALAILPWAGHEHVTVCYKIFLPHLQSTAIFNELFCYRLAGALSLAVPDDVCMIPCRKDQVVGPGRCLENRDPDPKWIAGVASVDLNPKRVVQLVAPTQLIVSELLDWPSLAKAAVLDELVLNVNRNQGALHRIGKNRFVLIDHEGAFGGPGWTLPKLKQTLAVPSAHNDLANFIAECADEELRIRLFDVAEDYAASLELTEAFIGIKFDSLDSRCGLELGTTEEVVSLINLRCKRLPELLFHHVKRRQLFQ